MRAVNDAVAAHRPGRRRQLRRLQRRGRRRDGARRRPGGQRVRRAGASPGLPPPPAPRSSTTPATSSSTAPPPGPTPRRTGPIRRACTRRRSCSASGSRSSPAGPSCSGSRACSGRRPEGRSRRGSMDALVAGIEAGREVPVFVDRTVSPSHVFDVAEATRALVASGTASGVYHCVNAGACSWQRHRRRDRAAAGQTREPPPDHPRVGLAAGASAQVLARSSAPACARPASPCRRGRTRSRGTWGQTPDARSLEPHSTASRPTSEATSLPMARHDGQAGGVDAGGVHDARIEAVSPDEKVREALFGGVQVGPDPAPAEPEVARGQPREQTPRGLEERLRAPSSRTRSRTGCPGGGPSGRRARCPASSS